MRKRPGRVPSRPPSTTSPRPERTEGRLGGATVLALMALGVMVALGEASDGVAVVEASPLASVGTLSAGPAVRFSPAEAPIPATVEALSATVTSQAAAGVVRAVSTVAPAALLPPGMAPRGAVAEAIEAWFPDLYGDAVRVAQCESSFYVGAVSPGDGNHGLYQINVMHQWNFEAVTGEPFDPGVYDPDSNARFARYLYDRAGWMPWACQPDGQVRQLVEAGAPAG